MPRVDQELLARGMARSRSHAAQLIAAGLVRIDTQPARKAAQQVTVNSHLQLASKESQDVSRAAQKLRGALDSFPEVTPRNKRCLDAGASTGGFTQVLLEAGAREVLAVDVGHDQLVPQLREHPYIQVYEGLNVRHITSEVIEEMGGPAELTVIDLSFISLQLVLPALSAATLPGGELLALVKPQFEVGKTELARQAGKAGVVTDARARGRAVAEVRAAAGECGLEVSGEVPSAVPGQDGNQEYFLWLTKPAQGKESHGRSEPAQAQETEA